MPVLNVLYRLMPSGAEKMLSDAAEIFRQNGVESSILVNDMEYGAYADALRGRGYRIHKIPYSRFGGHLIEMWKLCRKEKFDAVHIHVIRGFASIAVVSRFAGVKSIVKTFHGIFEPSGKIQTIMQLARRRIASWVGVKFVAISKSVQDNELSHFGTKTILIWNFADERVFALADSMVGRDVRSELEIPTDSFVLLSVGNCHSEGHMTIKNHSLVIKAIAMLPTDIKERIVYLHVGAEMEGLPERILAESVGVLRQIRFLGSRSDVWRLLCAANEFVMTSQKEGISISCIEASLSGRHLILTDVSGLCDYKDIIPDVTYVSLSSPKDLAGMIAKRFHSRGVEDGDIAIRTAALKTFSMKIGVEEYAKMYGV